MRTKLITTIFCLLFFAACEDQPQEKGAKLEGYDLKGVKSSCAPMDKAKACTEIYTEEDRFATKCREEGHIAIQCDCHKFLCDTKDGQPLAFD